MKMLNRTNQGGSVTSFVLIGFMLVIGLASSVYLFNHRAQQVRTEQSIAQSEIKESRSSESNTESKGDKTKVGQDEDSQKDVPVKPTISEGLPVTGGGDVAIQMLVLYFVTYFLVSYVISRRSVVQPL